MKNKLMWLGEFLGFMWIVFVFGLMLLGNIDKKILSLNSTHSKGTEVVGFNIFLFPPLQLF